MICPHCYHAEHWLARCLGGLTICECDLSPVAVPEKVLVYLDPMELRPVTPNTRERWVERAADMARFMKIKPPNSWLDEQDMDPDRAGNAKFAIWNRAYHKNLDKLKLAWTLAPDDDFVAVGYGRWED